MTPAMQRILTALLLAPQTYAQIATGLDLSECTIQTGMRRLRGLGCITNHTSRHHITGDFVKRHSLTQRGTEAAHGILNPTGDTTCASLATSPKYPLIQFRRSICTPTTAVRTTSSGQR